MKKTMKKFIFPMLLFIMALCLMPGSASQAATPKWKTAYRGILKNWKNVEKYQDTSYLKRYFGSDYKFDRYYVYDLNKDDTPELFLYSTKMKLTVILTYKGGKLRGLGYYAINGINKSQKEIIVKGHWHGSGGSGTKEWSTYKIKGNQMTMTNYIDILNGKVTIYNGKTYKTGTTAQYNKIYNAHIKNRTKISKFKMYKLSNTKGLTAQK